MSALITCTQHHAQGPPQAITQEKGTKKCKTGINLTKEIVGFYNISQSVTERRLKESERRAGLLGQECETFQEQRSLSHSADSLPPS